MRQCLLAMNDMRANNNGGEIYGFVTTGQMSKYDGELFKMTRTRRYLMGWMDEDKESWMKEDSVVVDCIYVHYCIK